MPIIVLDPIIIVLPIIVFPIIVFVVWEINEYLKFFIISSFVWTILLYYKDQSLETDK